MKDRGKITFALLIGAGLAYLLDPDRGTRRRALVRDKAVRTGHKLADELGGTTRDLRNRAGGAVAELRSRFRQDSVDDEVLSERVRSAIGRAVSHPRAIEVSATDGRVTLRGPVLEREVTDLVAATEGVRGVSEVITELELHQRPEGIPSLQGAGQGAGSS
jgi:osmotically-inducible protein OsmY